MGRTKSYYDEKNAIVFFAFVAVSCVGAEW